jgi:DNA-binding CsgD family transcriptional regulator
MGAVDDLVKARETFERGDWAAAFRSWSALQPAALGPDDLMGLAMSAWLVGRRDECLEALRQSFGARLEADECVQAARCAFWLSLVLSTSGQMQLGAGWAARAARLLEESGEEVVEHGYLAVLEMLRHLEQAEWAEVAECAERVAAVGRRFGDPDLMAMGISSQGRLLIYSGQVPEGLALLDEAMVGVAAGEMSPVFAGQVYCSMIEACQEISDVGRADEWTAALSRWCDSQPGLVPFTGQCAVHRGQIMRLRGAWDEAIDEFDRAVERYRAGGLPAASGLALAEHGDVLRLRGEYDAAEAAYQRAGEYGHEAQPSLALLWLARGRTAAALAAIGRLLAESGGPVQRSRLLPAGVEILVAADDIDGARGLARELDGIAHAFGCVALQAMAAYAAGLVELASDDASGALPYLRKAQQLWTRLECPYETARARTLIGRACAALGDHDSCAQELSAAGRTFADLGARPAVAEIDGLLGGSATPGGLTAREVEVLRLVARGTSNAEIAAALVLSEKTVARHLSNIFTKLAVGSRTAAAAYAFEHQLA